MKKRYFPEVRKQTLELYELVDNIVKDLEESWNGNTSASKRARKQLLTIQAKAKTLRVELLNVNPLHKKNETKI